MVNKKILMLINYKQENEFCLAMNDKIMMLINNKLHYKNFAR